MKQNTVPGLVKACEVLRQLVAEEGGLKQADIEKRVGLSRATAFRILTTLCQEGFACKEGAVYRVGNALSQMGFRALSSLNIRQQARPILEDLAVRSGETAHLAIRSGPHSLILEVCDSPNPIRVASRPGSLADLHCSATGKVFLAAMGARDAEELLGGVTLTARTARSLTRIPDVMAELRRVADLGYAIDDQEYFDDVRCLAVGVQDAALRVVAGIGVTGTASRFTPDDNERMFGLVSEAAEALSQELAVS